MTDGSRAIFAHLVERMRLLNLRLGGLAEDLHRIRLEVEGLDRPSEELKLKGTFKGE